MYRDKYLSLWMSDVRVCDRRITRSVASHNSEFGIRVRCPRRYTEKEGKYFGQREYCLEKEHCFFSESDQIMPIPAERKAWIWFVKTTDQKRNEHRCKHQRVNSRTEPRRFLFQIEHCTQRSRRNALLALPFVRKRISEPAAVPQYWSWLRRNHPIAGRNYQNTN